MVLENTELVTLRIGQDRPRNVSLSNVNKGRSESDQPLDVGSLIVSAKGDGDGSCLSSL